MGFKTKPTASIIKDLCVACGSCVPVCPKSAIKIISGIYADVDKNLCIGCKKCINVCPASVIKMEVSSR